MALGTTAADVIRHVLSRQRVFVHGGAATPRVLLQALIDDASRLSEVELIHLHTMGEAKYADPEFSKSFKVTNLFVGGNMRKKMGFANVDYLPCFLSQMPLLFLNDNLPLDVALIHVSPPDERGYCSFGTSFDIAKTAAETAKVVLAQINRQMPRVHGDEGIHLSQIHHFVEIDEPLPEERRRELTEIDKLIGLNVASLVEDGSTLQAGIGSIPDAVLSSLKSHRHLGVHSEMWSDGMLELIRCGAVDNSRKGIHVGKTVSTFVTGTRAVFDFINNNPSVLQFGAGYVNDPSVIAKNPKVVSINSAVEIDLTGQICADSVGSRIISGVGGQVDFISGASLSPGGKAIIAMSSRTRDRKPRIVPHLKLGGGVVTSRAQAHFIVTEYGVVDLFGKTLKERAKALIALAHSDDREALSRATFSSF
jgi:4-hydroxybutyrate CoA-transferase